MNRVGDEIVAGIEKVGQFAVDVDGEPVTLLSLPPGALAKIQDRTGLRWNQILLDPMGRMDVAADLVAAAYEKAGKTAPDVVAVGDLLRCFVEIPGDLPDPIPSEGTVEPDPTSAS